MTSVDITHGRMNSTTKVIIGHRRASVLVCHSSSEISVREVTRPFICLRGGFWGHQLAVARVTSTEVSLTVLSQGLSEQCLYSVHNCDIDETISSLVK